MDDIQSFRIICKGGLNTNQNYLELSELAPGYATLLVNYESALTGGYRRINGFMPYDPDAEFVTSVANPAEGPTLGVFGFNNLANGSFEVFACRKQVGSNTYKIYKQGSGWTAQNTGTTQNSLGVSKVRSWTYNFGGGRNVIFFVDGVNPCLAYDGTDWYQLKSDNNGGEESPGGDQIIDAPSIIACFKGHVFLSGDPANPAVVSFCRPNDFTDWTAANGGGQQIANFEVVQIKPFRDELFVFGTCAIKKSIPDAASGFVFQDVTTNMGCIARDSVFELAGNLVFLSNDGLRIVAGTSKIGDVDLTTVSQNIHNTIANIQANYSMNDIETVVLRTKTQFRMFIGDDAFTVPESYGIIGGIRIRDNLMWEFGELRGIRVNTAWSGYDVGGDEIVLHGDFNGGVYRQEVGSSFNGASIIALYRTPYLDLGDTEIRKTFRDLTTFINATGNFEISIGLKLDWDDIYRVNPINWNKSSEGNTVVYDSGVKYDQGHKYGGPSQPIVKTSLEGTGYAGQITYVSNGIYAPYTIQGQVIEFSAEGRY